PARRERHERLSYCRRAAGTEHHHLHHVGPRALGAARPNAARRARRQRRSDANARRRDGLRDRTAAEGGVTARPASPPETHASGCAYTSCLFTWHIHGSSLCFLAHTPCPFILPVRPDRGERYAGRSGAFPWPDIVVEVPGEEIRDTEFDVILFQADENYLED